MKSIAGVEVLDSLEELVDPEYSAVLVIDIQNDFCHHEGHFARFGKDLRSTRRWFRVRFGSSLRRGRSACGLSTPASSRCPAA